MDDLPERYEEKMINVDKDRYRLPEKRETFNRSTTENHFAEESYDLAGEVNPEFFHEFHRVAREQGYTHEGARVVLTGLISREITSPIREEVDDKESHDLFNERNGVYLLDTKKMLREEVDEECTVSGKVVSEALEGSNQFAANQEGEMLYSDKQPNWGW